LRRALRLSDSADPLVPGPFFLQTHVFLCQGKRHWVILDVNRDKYLCVERRQFESLGPSIKGWEGTAVVGAGVVPEDAVALANDLLSLGILSERAIHAKDALPTAYPLPTDAVDPDLLARSHSSSFPHLGLFFRSSARAARELRGERFQGIVESVRSRKSRNVDRDRGLYLERALALVSIFDRLRLFYPRSYLCLFDSLALIHFLAHFHVYPDWVFGVAADPFEAHCWVQAGNVVLNDTLERVSGFTPIMCV
jgi:Transglutaminase-like superfamily